MKEAGDSNGRAKADVDGDPWPRYDKSRWGATDDGVNSCRVSSATNVDCDEEDIGPFRKIKFIVI